MLLSILFVSYNTAALTQQAIKAADADAQHSSLLKDKVEFIVVDNNSQDNSVEVLKQVSKDLHHSLHIIENSKNTGFAQANNKAIKNAKGEFILLLNSDTQVKPGALAALVQTFLKHQPSLATATLSSYQKATDNIGIVAALLLNPDGTIQPQGGDLPSLLSLCTHLFFLDDIPVIGRLLPSTQHTGLNSRVSKSMTEPLQMGWVGGTAMLLSRKLIDSIGDLDENIFMYAEDIELCLRARHHLFDIVIQPQAQITHYGSQSSSSANAIKGEMVGYKYIWSKHFPHWQVPVVTVMLKLACFIRFLVFSTIGRQEQATLYRTLLQSL